MELGQAEAGVGREQTIVDLGPVGKPLGRLLALTDAQQQGREL